MIKPKLKKCSGCHNDKFLWSSHPPKCKECHNKAKYSGKEEKPKVKKIPQFSDKMLNQLAAYRRKRKKYLIEHPECEAKISSLCCGKSDQIHHQKGRQKYLADERYFLAVDFPCHRWIEENPEKAKELGFSLDRLTD